MDTSKATPCLRSALLASVGLAGMLLFAAPALAETAPPPAGETAAPPVEGGLQDIVVTARKRTESAQNIPVSVTAISQERIERLDLTSIEKVAASTPQFNIGRASNGSGAQITLRGIGSQSTSIGLESSTAIIVDGVYYGDGHIINQGFFDIARVEMLKGPQALFFGKNATAGAVSITTADPTQKFEMMVRAGYEVPSRNLVGEGYISGPLSSTLSARLAVRVSNMWGGYFTNAATPTPISIFDIATGTLSTHMQQPNSGGQPGTNEKLIRATLKWTPTNRLTATLKVSATRVADQSNAWNYVPFACPLGYTQPNPAVVCKPTFTVYVPNAPDGVAGSFPGSKADGSPYNLYHAWNVTGTIAYNLDKVAITSVSNYNWSRNEWGLGQNVNSSTSYISATENTSIWAFSNETRVQTTYDGPINVMAGIYYQRMQRDYVQYDAFAALEDSSQPSSLRYLSVIKDSQTKGETIAGFGQVTWKVLPRVELAAGVRYTHETKDSYLTQPYVNAALAGLILQDVPFTANQVFNNWSPEATVTWKPVDDITVYAAFKTGYKSGGFSNGSTITAASKPSDVAFNPERVVGFEGGIKTTLMDRQLRLNLGVYDYKYKNLQVDYFNSISFQFITTNAGSVSTKGFELEAEFAPRAVPGLNLRGTLNYNRARYADYVAPCYGGQSIAAGCDTTFQGGLGQNLSGKPTALAPDWTASLGGDFEQPVGRGLRAGLSVDARYSAKYFGSSFAVPLSLQKAYVNLDASLRLRTEDDHWEIAVIGRNLTNNFHIGGVLDLPNSGSGTGTASAIPGDQIGLANLPRTVRFQLTWRY